MESKSFTCVSSSVTDTDQIGAALAAFLPDGTTVSLLGTLGAGKTHLVQAIAAACGVPREDVTSPTFVLCQHYHGTRTIHHLDAYRVKDDDEFLELGVEELFASAGLTIVEWGDRVEGCLPPERIEIEITVLNETDREFEIRATDERLASVIEATREGLGGGD